MWLERDILISGERLRLRRLSVRVGERGMFLCAYLKKIFILLVLLQYIL